MVLFIVFTIILAVFEIRGMIKRKLLKECIIFIVIGVISLVIGVLYFSSPDNYSFAKIVLSFFDPKYR